MDVHTCTCCHPPSKCFLVGAFNLLTFKVIIDMYDPIAAMKLKELTPWKESYDQCR